MTDYVQQIRKNSDFVAVHAGANDLPIKKKTDIAAEVKANSCNISILNIALRNNQYRKKVSAVDHRLKDLCKKRTYTIQIIALTSTQDFKWFKF